MANPIIPLPLLVITGLFFATPLAGGHDWFVRAGSAGDGTKEKPFKDPFLALEEAEPGDTIHVAHGVYHGSLNSGNWRIATPNLTLLGGYNEDFSKRDPWHFPSTLCFTKDFRGKNYGTILEGGQNSENLVLDGFVFDQSDRNAYGQEPYASLADSGRSSEPVIQLAEPGAQIRNCLVLNGNKGGIEVGGAGSRIENNIILNMDAGPLISFRSHEGKTAVVKGNTLLFSWSSTGVGDGGYPAGRGVSFWSSDHALEISDNIVLGCDGWAVDARQAKDLTLQGNIFWLNGSSNVKVETAEGTVHINNSNMADLEDVGLKTSQGNAAANPELTGLDPKWMEKFLDRVAEDYPGAKLEELNGMRSSLGLPTVTEKKAQGPVSRAMAYDWTLALRIVPAKLKQGAHPVAIEVQRFPAASTSVAQQYERTTWQKLAESPQALNGKRVEITGALGQEASTFSFTGITEDDYRGFEFHDLRERLGQAPIVYLRKGSRTERKLKDFERWDGNGGPPERHLIRGLAKYEAGVKSNRKGTITVDSITTLPDDAPAASKPRPLGRDWFVRAGSSGNGSKNQPFKDPWQALEVAKPGDTIHVAEGEYFGKLKSGHWTIKIAYLSLLGGYDQQFQQRDPWKHPSRLGYSPGASEGSSGAYLVGEGDHTGLIFDGFVLDGRDVNRLDSSGNLASRFPESELIRLGSPDLTVRNCVLLNSAGAALVAWGDHLLIENNLILNCNYYSIELSSAPKQPAIIRNNTVLFTWHADRAQDPSSAGTALFAHGMTRFELNNNIFGYADGQSALAYEHKRIKILNNVFTHNRYANLTDLDQMVIDDRNLASIGEFGFAAAEGNVVLDPQMSFDKAWWTEYSRAEGPAFFARPYDWKQALNLLPQNPACKAGARPVRLEVHFNP